MKKFYSLTDKALALPNIPPRFRKGLLTYKKELYYVPDKVRWGGSYKDCFYIVSIRKGKRETFYGKRLEGEFTDWFKPFEYPPLESYG